MLNTDNGKAILACDTIFAWFLYSCKLLIDYFYA